MQRIVVTTDKLAYFWHIRTYFWRFLNKYLISSENNHGDDILAEEHQSQPFLNTTNGGKCVTIESKKIAEKCESNQAIHV